MLEQLFETIGSLGGSWAYVAVGLLAAAESSMGVGLFVPGETAMLVGGFVASQGNADYRLMLVVAVAGAITGDSVGYEIGRRFGPAVRRTRLGRRVGDERWDRAQEYLSTRGGKAIFFARFVAVVRSVVPAIAGISRMRYRRFLAFNALGGVTWAAIYVTLGFVAGRSYDEVADRAEDAGLVLLGLVFLLVAAVLVARWVVRRPDRARAFSERVLGGRVVAWVAARCRGALDFLQARFRPNAAFGLSFTFGLAVLIAVGWGAGAVVFDVLGRDDLVGVDRPLLDYLADHRVDWLTDVMRAVTALGSAAVLVPVLTTAALAWVAVTRRWSVVVFIAVAAVGANLLSDVLKALVERPRPVGVAAIDPPGSFAFPSGHTTSSTVAYGALAYLFGSVVRHWGLRVSIWTLALLVALLVGFSRAYLGVHWPTDVVGGHLLGAAWLAFVVTTFGTVTRVRRTRAHTRKTASRTP